MGQRSNEVLVEGDCDVSLGVRWSNIQQRFRSFVSIVSRWRSNYFAQLKSRSKWHRPSAVEPSIGDILLKKDQSKLTNWLHGRIVETFPGIDGNVRVVNVWVGETVKRRLVMKLILLISSEEVKLKIDVVPHSPKARSMLNP